MQASHGREGVVLLSRPGWLLGTFVHAELQDHIAGDREQGRDRDGGKSKGGGSGRGVGPHDLLLKPVPRGFLGAEKRQEKNACTRVPS